MKRLITALFLLLSVTVFSQERGDKRAELTNEERAELGARMLAMQLDLNEKQEKELKALYAEQIEYRKALMAENRKNKEESKEKREELRKEFMKLNEEQRANLQEILTVEQYGKWENLQEKRRKGRLDP